MSGICVNNSEVYVKREKRMNDPKTGINSPAFKEFMKQYGG